MVSRLLPQALLYIGGPTTLMLLLGAGVWERDGLLTVGLPLLQAHPLPFLAAFIMSALVNMTCFFAIQNTSSLSFKVGLRCQNNQDLCSSPMLRGICSCRHA